MYGDKTVSLCYGCKETFSFKCTLWNLWSINMTLACIVWLFHHNCTRMFLNSAWNQNWPYLLSLCAFLVLLCMIHWCTSFQRKHKKAVFIVFYQNVIACQATEMTLLFGWRHKPYFFNPKSLTPFWCVTTTFHHPISSQWIISSPTKPFFGVTCFAWE